MKDFKLLSITFLICLFCLSLGCARTITSKIIAGQNIRITLYLRSSIDTAKFKYLIVFSKTEQPLFPKSGTYFIAPGQFYDEEKLSLVAGTKGINYFYDNYLYTWCDYLLFRNSFYLYNSGSTFAKTTTENAHYNYSYRTGFNPTWGQDTNKLVIDFPLSNLSGIGNSLYLSFATMSKDTDLLYDSLDFSPLIPVESITDRSGTDIEDSQFDGAADIISWSARIYD
jgi:hypothetical protein